MGEGNLGCGAEVKRAAGILFIEPGSRAAFLVRRSALVSEPGTWANPGGHVQPGEDDLGAAMRETFEETGLRPMGEPVGCVETQNESGLHYALFVALVSRGDAEAARRACHLNWENDAAAWFPIERLPDQLHPGLAASWPYVRKLIAS